MSSALVHAAEHQRFRAGEREFAFLVPSSMVVELDADVRTILDRLQKGPAEIDELATSEERTDALRELARVGAVVRDNAPDVPMAQLATPEAPPPLSTIVLNVTNSCNLSCRYCYEYGDDRIEAAAAPEIMTVATARQSVDTLFAESGRNDKLQITFFGGETLLNFKVIRPTVEYARERAQELGKFVDFSLTTNATLLTRDISQWLADNRIGITVSIDGPKDVQDSMRVYGKTGMGSYDVVAPRIRELLSLYKTRPIGARVTLTSKSIDVPKIFHHLTEEMGFYEVGFAPVTSSSGLEYAIDGDGFDELLHQFRALSERYVEAAIDNRYLGFSNLSDMLGEIHKGVSKAYPCGAGLGLVGVAPGGEIGLCHRFAGAGDHDFGHVTTGVDNEKRVEHLEKGHIDKRTDCSTCWVRSLCSGGCYHEAQVRYGDRFRPNIHYCDWIREWTAMGLQAYGQILNGNPSFLDRFDERKVA